MSTSGVSKVDMSLDEIIKLNRKESKQNKASRGRGGITTARGGGRRGYRSRGSKISRGGAQTYQDQGSTTGRGSAISRSWGNTRARGNLRTWGRGRGMNQGNRAGNNKEHSTTFNTASGRARRGNLSGRLGNFRGALRGRGTKRGGLNSGGDNSLTSLHQKRQVALKALQLAHRTLANIERQTARTNLVNTKRGITAPQGESLGLQSQQLSGSTLSLTSSQGSRGGGSRGRGRGRGRQLNRHLLGTQVTSYDNPKPRGRGRGWLSRSQIPASNISVSIDNPSTNTRQLLQPHSQPRRRPWRRPQQYNTSDRVVPQTSIAKDLMKLKPTESMSYVFQKNAFSAGSTSQSLNERFSSVTGGRDTDAAEVDSSGRKVFF
ncbi:THO complex subunit 4-like isoform X1 [Pomacea canaliculata]|uniref:THO complex subunit 4-like isoform X1 n=1 Tax=Pomacea canaliculata TaxID=400727 RepID=UPI000D733997|nr:THO complex subunit 4-like isoform X1 [Pomacea canaliculata]